jgi:hypothetical protein
MYAFTTSCRLAPPPKEDCSCGQVAARPTFSFSMSWIAFQSQGLQSQKIGLLHMAHGKDLALWSQSRSIFLLIESLNCLAI